MTLKSDAKFEEKLTCCLENDIQKNLTDFQESIRKCSGWNTRASECSRFSPEHSSGSGWKVLTRISN